MGVRELGARLRYRALLSLERRTLPAASRPQNDGRGALAARFFAGVDDRAAMQHLFRSRFQPELETARRIARDARAHVFPFFGLHFHAGAPVDWHADPVSGRRWPEQYHADLRPLLSSAEVGDVKYVWELNRHQFLVDLGKACFLDDDGESAAEAVALLRHWRRSNPYGIGVNWACALEPAYRVFSWLWTYYLCRDADTIDDRARTEWRAGLDEHGRFLYRHLELYSSPYNHLITEAAALFALGLVCREFDDAHRWAARGRHVLESRLGDQFYADGGSVEQATFYHHATLSCYLMAAVLAERHGEPLSARVSAALHRALRFSAALTQPDGLVPMVGDCDDGKPVRMQHRMFWDFRPLLAAGAVLFSDPELKFAAGGFHEDALWLLGPAGLSAFERLESRAPASLSAALEASGYCVLRSDWSRRASFVCFDCGEQAGGLRADDIPSAAHGHADCLSLTLFLRGRPLLVDAGFFTYNGEDTWERWFRSTAAHNTGRVDRQDQARHLGKMTWSNAAPAALEAWFAEAPQAAAVGSHEGYLRLGVTHRRAVWLRPGEYVIVADEFVGTPGHDVELAFQLPAAAECALDEASATVLGVGALRWFSREPFTASLQAGGPGPSGGWIAPSLGVRVAAPRIALSARMHEETLHVVTLALPDGMRASMADSASRTVRLHVSDGTWTDEILVTDSRQDTAGALVTIRRLQGDDLIEERRLCARRAGAPAPGRPC